MKKPNQFEIDKAKQTLLEAGYLPVYWHREDVEVRIEEEGYEPTKKNINKVMNTLSRRFDASQGINWDVINAVINVELCE